MKRLAAGLLLGVLAAACQSAPTRSGPGAAPPGTSTSPAPSSPQPAAAPGFTEADVRFMQGMIGHHAQALEMTALLKTRTTRDDMKLLALRIEVSQRDEIKQMQQWLRDRGQSAPDEHAHHAHDAKLMPGMLTPDEMARLTAATGPEFDRLFLELMIRHHQGALVMVRELLAQPGAAQNSEIFAFASDVESDQSMEINRMRAMLTGK
jgi:uncharacterized protein (DUF305 family)